MSKQQQITEVSETISKLCSLLDELVHEALMEKDEQGRLAGELAAANKRIVTYQDGNRLLEEFVNTLKNENCDLSERIRKMQKEREPSVNPNESVSAQRMKELRRKP